MKSNRIDKVILFFISFLLTSCFNTNSDSFLKEDSLVIKIISPYSCKYYFLYKNESLTIKSENYSYNPVTNKQDSVISIQNIKLTENEKKDVISFREGVLHDKSNRIDNKTSHDLYKYELIINGQLIRRALCCDDSITNFIKRTVLNHIDKNNIVCDSFIDMIIERSDG